MANNESADRSDVQPIKESVAGEKFYLVIVGDTSDEVPRLIECDGIDAFTAAVSDQVLGAKDTIHAFGFRGVRVMISEPSPVCVFEIDGLRASVGTDNRRFDASGRIVPLRQIPDR
jgi:hypothetical protein